MTAVEVGYFGNDDSEELGLAGCDVASLYLGRLSLGERQDFFSMPLGEQDAKLKSMMWQNRDVDGLSSYEAYRVLNRLAGFINGGERKAGFYYPLLGNGDSLQLAWAIENKFRRGIGRVAKETLGLDETPDVPEIRPDMPAKELLGFKLKLSGQNGGLSVQNDLEFTKTGIPIGSKYIFAKKRTLSGLINKALLT